MINSTENDLPPKGKHVRASEPLDERESDKAVFEKIEPLKGKHARPVESNACSCHEKPVYTDTKREKSGKKRKILLSVCLTLAGLLAFAIANGILYFKSIEKSLEYEGDVEALNSSLVEANHQEPFYVLIIGSDKWENYGARSDAMVLARVDLSMAKVTMVSIPRDTPYSIGDRTVKLNQVFAEEGEAACIDAVAELTGVDISHYIEVEFGQLEQVVDSLGGVRVEVPYAFDYQVYTKDEPVIHVDEGEQVLTGEQAVAFARMRTSYSYEGITQDGVRQANIRALMVGIIKQVLEKPANEIPGQVQTLASMVQTDIPMTDLVSWATIFAQAPKVTLYTCTGPTEGSVDETTGLWLTEESPAQWALLMHIVDSGTDPSMSMGFDESNDGKVQLSKTEVLD